MLLFKLLGLFVIIIGLYLCVKHIRKFKIMIESTKLWMSYIKGNRQKTESQLKDAMYTPDLEFDMSAFDHEINEAKVYQDRIINDLIVFQAFNSNVLMSELLLFVAAYILEYKVHYKVRYSYMHMFNKFKNIESFKRSDRLADIINSTFDDNTKKLVINILEKALITTIKIKPRIDETIKLNTVLALVRLGLEYDENDL